MEVREDVLNKVNEILVEALGADEEDVTPDAKLVSDLGAESIDFLDIVFRLEKAFGIKIEQAELFPENVLSNSDYVVNGVVTDEGMTVLRNRLPHADLDRFDEDRQVEHFWDIFTVDTLVNFVMAKLEAAKS
ncbi:MAG: acyl carrier protein [Phycisphaeraceae bacterium]|nr:acyl carrier protein [Phycisphaeraceae bacterium]